MKTSAKVGMGVVAGVVAAAAYTNRKSIKKLTTTDEKRFDSSESLTQELERESGKEIQRINTMGGTFGNYAGRDKSWNNVGDFFSQMVKGRTK